MLHALTESDIPALVIIEDMTQKSAPWSAETFKQCMTIGSLGWVIEDQHKIIGFVLLLLKAGEGHILNIAVHPDYQRRGYGQQLFNKVISVACEEKVTILFLEVRASNLSAIALYKKMGFNQIGMRKGYYVHSEGREDALVLAKDLSLPMN